MAWIQKSLNLDALAPQNQYHRLVHFHRQMVPLLFVKSNGYVLYQSLYALDHLQQELCF